MSAILIALDALMTAGSAALAWGHVQRVRSAGPVDSAALVRALKAVPQGSRIAELSRLADPATWEGSLAKELLGAESPPPCDDAAQSRSEVDAERVVIVNDALESVEHDLSVRASWPRAGRRLALLGTVLALVVAKLSDQLTAILPILVLGGASVLVITKVDRSAKHETAKKRADIDSLIEALVGRPTGAALSPSTRRRRSSRRRGTFA